MDNLEHVKDLRRRLKGSFTVGVEHAPGVYRWWFADNSATRDLMAPLGDIDMSRVQRRVIDGREYLALYFGIAKDLSERIAWHVGQTHTGSTVRHGFLSTLRQTLSALLGIDMTLSQEAVNGFQDDNCCLEFGHTCSREEACIIEERELTGNYYPLNLAGNKTVGRDVLGRLRALRRLHKK